MTRRRRFIVVGVLGLVVALCFYCAWPLIGVDFTSRTADFDPDQFPAITLENARRIKKGMSVHEVAAIIRAAPGGYYGSGLAPPVSKGRVHHVLIPVESYEVNEQIYHLGGPNVYQWGSDEGRLYLYVEPNEGVVACVFYEELRPPLPWHVRFKAWLKEQFK